MPTPSSKLSALSPRRGQAALSFVFLIGIITLSIGVTVALLAASFLNSGYGFQSANKAMSLAYAGAEDALMRLARNKDFSSVSAYSVPVGSDSASVTVNQNSPVTGEAKIISTATSFFQQKKIQVIVAINSTTGEVDVISWQSLAL
ncbi:MAG TPA: hypothetical protein VMV71_00185 [Candidatus Paceibacterota bacterium]|nr:hypothetical protein [Candidatus Paceibacterota bacterium]